MIGLRDISKIGFRKSMISCCAASSFLAASPEWVNCGREHAQQNRGVAPSVRSQCCCSILPELPAGRAEIPIIATRSERAVGEHRTFITLEYFAL
jgi:hypothetical protein